MAKFQTLYGQTWPGIQINSTEVQLSFLKFAPTNMKYHSTLRNFPEERRSYQIKAGQPTNAAH
jgi:hypothetical protein